ncbi:hypothetical protein [Miltoncostaea marina]|uniref:hypothetical protein n=1 Tax=Miltoncostaea marina TaxID=2843215 RepID=UPI001C3CF4C2|nr:hypothetical protein [Miltoncostaea marina]
MATCPLCGSRDGLDVVHDPVGPRLARRIAEVACRSGVGTSAGVRMRSAATGVPWGEVVEAPEAAVVEAFALLVRAGMLRVEGNALVIPWEASDVYTRILEDPGWSGRPLDA